ncbi:MAG: binding-protein-dependent transport system inner rane component [Thermomicrobiales bacterium]|nr:binding-protein-dependent transport system inner rane component [Thermomicrobiales bacterium]
MRYIFEHPDRMLELTQEHLRLVAISILVAMAIGIPLGILITRLRWLEGSVIATTGVLYTVPSLALFAILMPFTGLGPTTVIVALVLYSLLAIVRNTVAGIDDVPPAALDAARGMGMTGSQRLLLVELPLALPVILAGVRVAAVAAVGIATVGALLGAGGLGRLIFEGISRMNTDRIIAGAVGASALALVADWGLSRLGDFLRRDVRLSGR